MSEFSQYFRNANDLRKRKEERDREAARLRLLKQSKKKIQTTMIGAIHSIETHLGYLWDQEIMTPEEIQMKEIFEELRSEILDRGNNQIRNLENEFNNYEISWKRYSMDLPFLDRRDDA